MPLMRALSQRKNRGLLIFNQVSQMFRSQSPFGKLKADSDRAHCSLEGVLATERNSCENKD